MSDGPDLLERVRMCLAEVGVSDRGVWVDDEGAVVHPLTMTLGESRMVWRAEMLCTGSNVCFECDRSRWMLDGDDYAAVGDGCLARLPLTEDCGVDR